MFRLALILLFLLPTYSYAYLGPAIGGGIIIGTLGFIVVIFAAIFGVLWFPIKIFLKNRKNKKQQKK